ncbi:MAG: hypothetical protein AB7F59_06810 [Bdellovibrionales bacterium]
MKKKITKKLVSPKGLSKPVIKKTASARSQELIELFVKGVVVGPGHLRPVLLLKDKAEQETFPVWLNPLEFESLDVQNSPALKSSYFHIITRKIMKEIGYRLDRCCFTDIVGHRQYVNLFMVKEEPVESKKIITSLTENLSVEGRWIQASAEEAMSLCLAMGTRYFATPDVIEKSRYINSELVAAFVELPQHPYIM